MALAELPHPLAVGERVGALRLVEQVGAGPEGLGRKLLEHELAGAVERLVVVHHEVRSARKRAHLANLERLQVVQAHAGKLAGVDGAVGGKAGAREVEHRLLVLLPEEVRVVGLEGRQALAEESEHALELLGGDPRRLEVLLHEVVLEGHDEAGLAPGELTCPLA